MTASDVLAARNMSLASEPVIVLGTFRGGTSCLATALNELGVYFGPEDEFQPASEQNPGGFWELRKMQRLNARALLIFGMDYFRASSLPTNWMDTPGAAEAVAEMRHLLTSKFGGHLSWGWKEPSTTILMPLYDRALLEEGINQYSSVIGVRHPLSVAASQRSRYQKWGYKAEMIGAYDMPPVFERTVGLWVLYTLTTLRETKGKKRQVVVYENFLENPKAYVERMSDFLLDGRPNAAQRKSAIDSVDPKLSHSKHQAEDLDQWPPIVQRVFALALRLDADNEGLNKGDYDDEIESLYKEWTSMRNLMREVDLPAAQMTFVWLDGAKQERISYPYVQTGGWQRMRLQVSAPPNCTVQIDPSQLPCRMWIRKAVWHAGGQEFPAALKAGPNGVLQKFFLLSLSAFGPAALMTVTPPIDGTPTLELEILVQTGDVALRNILSLLTNRPARTPRQPAHLEPALQSPTRFDD